MDGTCFQVEGLEPAEWTIPADADEVASVRFEVCAYAARAGLAANRVEDVRLAVSEAVTNAVMHAYRDRETGEVTISASVPSPGRLRVVVADDGIGFGSRPDSPGLGLGVPLIGSVTETMEVRTFRGGGTELHMHFRA